MTTLLHKIPYLGNGIGFRPELKPFIFLNRDKIDFVEIIAEHYMDVPDAKLQELELLKSYFTVIPHAINLSLGSAKGIDKRYTEKLARLIAFIDPPYWSEHISYTQAHGTDAGHLSPIIYNQAFMGVMADNIMEVKKQISTPLILENITYHVELPGKEYSDSQFLNRLCEATGCGLLLDLANLYINSKNFHFDPYTFIDELKPDNIVQLHYVGYEDGVFQLTDTHQLPTQAEIFSLMDFLLSHHIPKGILLERDGRYQEHEEIQKDLETVKHLLARYEPC